MLTAAGQSRGRPGVVRSSPPIAGTITGLLAAATLSRKHIRQNGVHGVARALGMRVVVGHHISDRSLFVDPSVRAPALDEMPYRGKAVAGLGLSFRVGERIACVRRHLVPAPCRNTLERLSVGRGAKDSQEHHDGRVAQGGPPSLDRISSYSTGRRSCSDIPDPRRAVG